MPKNLHISIPKLKSHKPKSPHSPTHYTSAPTRHFFFGHKHHKSSSHTLDRSKSYGHDSSAAINGQMESPLGALFDSPRLMFMRDPPNLRGSHRFFVTTDSSSSLAEEARPSAASRDDGFAVAMYSSEPYVEFCRSMVEMVGSRLEKDLTVDWDYMQELLVCYLQINEKRSHKYILSAFVDVVEGLRQISGERPATACNIPAAGERRRKRHETL